MALSDADPRTSPSRTSARASSDPSKQRTTISDAAQKHLPPRQNEEQKAKRIRGRWVEITLISNRSGCRSTPIARPPTPQTEKKRQSHQYTTPESTRSTRISTSPAADLASRRGTAQRVRSRVRGGEVARRELEEVFGAEDEREREREARARTMVAPATATEAAARRGARLAEVRPWRRRF